MGYNGVYKYVIKYKLIPTAQYAAKKGAGSEDCLIDFTIDVDWQIRRGIPVRAGAVDSSDAFNAMMPMIIEQKLVHYCGFDEAAMTMYKSWVSNVQSICKVNDT
eukprot:113075_1